MTYILDTNVLLHDARSLYAFTDATVVIPLDVLEELDWVQSVWDAAESLWPEAVALEERDSGLRPPKIPHRKLVTRHGVYRGGYFPAMYDRLVEKVGELQVADTIAGLMDPSFARPTTPHSHLKRRARRFAGAISLEPANIAADAGCEKLMNFLRQLHVHQFLFLAEDRDPVLEVRLPDVDVEDADPALLRRLGERHQAADRRCRHPIATAGHTGRWTLDRRAALLLQTRLSRRSRGCRSARAAAFRKSRRRSTSTP